MAPVLPVGFEIWAHIDVRICGVTLSIWRDRVSAVEVAELTLLW